MSQSLPPLDPGQISFRYIRELIGADARVILEIGANDGTHTVKFLNHFPNANIYAFEPDRRALEKFKANVPFNTRAHLFEIALGAKDGEAEFYESSGVNPDAGHEFQEQYPEGWDQSGSLRAPKTHIDVWPWCKFERTITVPVRRLDSWTREHGITAIDFIIADVQGAEGDLVDGGRSALKNCRYFYTEYSNEEWYEGQPNLRQLLEMLPGFSILRLFSKDVLLKNTAF
jgi:FkbM family methyltransferase